MNITALAGGVGGAKLLIGLYRTAAPLGLTTIVNTGDDATIYGVHVSPDIDTVTYWLAGLADTERGWGIRGDTFTVVEALERLGTPGWFRLGDKDLATCLWRTERLRAGATLSSVTEDIVHLMGVEARVLPMSDDRVPTEIECFDGRVLDFQTYFVRERCAPEVSGVRLSAAAGAKPAPGVIDAIRDSERVILCPSNPVLSVNPILALPGVRDALREHERVIAVSPIVAGAALKGPADRVLRSLGLGSGAPAVAALYADFCDVFVLDERDAGEAAAVEALGMRAILLDTIMSDADKSRTLARALVAL